MARIFENTLNGYTETVDGSAPIWVLIFGGMYLIKKGLWEYAALWFLIVGVSPALNSPQNLLIVFPVTAVCFALSIRQILVRNYLSRGWKEVTKPTEWYRNCPYCAEEVKADAILCKHCRSELLPVQKPDKS